MKNKLKVKETLEELVKIQKEISNNNCSSINVAYKCVCDC